MTELTIKQQLANVLAAHKEWIKSDGQNGERLDLSYANLTDAFLWGTNLTGANLHYANLIDVKGLKEQ